MDNDLGFSFERPHGPDGGRKLSLDKIRAAEDAGLDLQFFSVAVCRENGATFATYAHVTLLDMAIWYGQPSCGEACVDGGIELKDGDRTLAWQKRTWMSLPWTLCLLKLKLLQQLQAVHGCNARGRANPRTKALSFTR